MPNSNCVGEIVQDQIALGRGYDKHKMPYAGRCLNDGQACSAGRYSVLDELMSFSYGVVVAVSRGRSDRPSILERDAIILGNGRNQSIYISIDALQNFERLRVELDLVAS